MLQCSANVDIERRMFHVICRDHCEILSGQTRDVPSFKLHHIGFEQLLNLGMAHVLQTCHADLIAASCCRTITSSDTGGIRDGENSNSLLIFGSFHQVDDM